MLYKLSLANCEYLTCCLACLPVVPLKDLVRLSWRFLSCQFFKAQVFAEELGLVFLGVVVGGGGGALNLAGRRAF